MIEIVVFAAIVLGAPAQQTYAERLGWERGSRVLILHCDDAGMSHDTNVGTIESMTKGVATSASVMMPCPWVPEFVQMANRHPELDIGLHLTLTSEWRGYRWGPIAGKSAVPGLVDREGCLWHSVAQVAAHASADEVEKEIRAQIDRAETIGLRPTHLDSHMGTIFARPDYIACYVRVGIEKDIPIFVAASFVAMAEDRYPALVPLARMTIKQIWDAGLPILDHFTTASESWEGSDKRARYREFIATLKPGVTMAIVHPATPTDVFPAISNSGPTRRADFLAMRDPVFKQLLQDVGIILTTWRELKQRRDRVEARTTDG